MVDIVGWPSGTLSAGDFVFRTGNDDDPGAWPAGPAPSSITVRPGEGRAGSDRVTLIWPNHDPAHPDTTAVAGQWLQVTVLESAATGMTAPDVFYFGNAIGESGEDNSPQQAFVTVADELAARTHTQQSFVPAEVDNPHDYNKDSFVTLADELIARDNATGFLDALRLITVPPRPTVVETAATGQDR